MASYSDEDIQKVREANDILDLMSEISPLKQRGKDYWCCCPVHAEKTPSCKIDTVLQLWHCFGCGEGGDIFSLIMKTQDLSFPEAIEHLAERAHIDITPVNAAPSRKSSPKARLRDICKLTAEYYHQQLMKNPDPAIGEARTYLSGRNLGGSIPKSWLLGYAPGGNALINHLSAKGYKINEMVEANVATIGQNGKARDRFYRRIMFPIQGIQGDVIAFGGRVIGKGEPKYLNSQETPLFHKSEVLYGLYQAKNSLTATGEAIIVEGYTDVIALHEAGVTNAVATLGTALTSKHIRLLSRYAKKRIIYLFDGDEAGQRAADRALGFIDMQIAPESGRQITELAAVTLPDNLDPAEFIEQQGAEALHLLLEAATPLIQYGINRKLQHHDLNTAEGRSAALTDALGILAPIKESSLARDYARTIAFAVRAREEDVLRNLQQLQIPRKYDEEERSITPAPVVSQTLSQVERNRRRIERKFLSALIANPLAALEHANVLAQTNWRSADHAQLAELMLDILSEKPDIDAQNLASRIISAAPSAEKLVFNSTSLSTNENADELLFLIDEINLGDMQEQSARLRQELQHLGNDTEEDRVQAQMIYENLAALQNRIMMLKKNHLSLS